jgi:hypothetical protein
MEAHRLDGACVELECVPWMQGRKASECSGEGRKRTSTNKQGREGGNQAVRE